jgi:hypothetical protein
MKINLDIIEFSSRFNEIFVERIKGLMEDEGD